MWTIERAEAENFRSFAKLEWDLTKCRPLTLILGNRGTGRSNGSGKTSLFALLCWVIYGQLPKKPKTLKKIIKRGTDTCTGKVIIRDDAGTFTIERKQTAKGSALTVSGMDERALIAGQQEAINARIGTFDLFLATSMFCGNASSFCRLGDADRKELMANMAGVGRYGKAAELAKQRMDEVRADLERADGRVSGLMAAVEELQAIKASRSLQSLRAALVIKRKWRAIRDRVDAACEAKDDAFDALREWTRDALSKRADIAAGVRKLAEDLDNREAEREKIDAEKQAIAERLGDVRSRISAVNDEIRAATDGTHPDMCPTCGQRWPHDHDPDLLAKKLADLRAKLATWKDKKAAIDADMARVDDARDVCIDAIRDLKADTATLKASVDEREYRRVLTDALEAEQQLNSANEALLDFENTHTLDADDDDAPDEIAERLAKAKDDVKVARETCDGLRVQYDQYEFWRKGFSRTGLPSFLIDGFVPDLTDFASSIAAELTDGELVLRFNSDATRGSQSVFDVDVDYTNGGEGFDCASRGEETRVDIAVLFAIRDLAAKRQGKECSQLFMDEVTDGADEAFVDAFIRLLRNRYKGRQVFIISHEAAAVSLCDATIVVKKKGSTATLKT